MDTDYIELLYDTANRCNFALRTDSRVMAIYLIGSLARGEADANSDVDLCILVSRGQLKYIIEDVKRIAASVGPALVSGQLHDSNTYSVLYDLSGQLVKVDYDYFDMEELPDLIRSSMNTRTYLFHRKILFDRHGAIENQFNSVHFDMTQTFSQVSYSPFFISAWSVIRMVRRGELLEAIDIMNHMRDPLLTKLLCQRYDVPFENYRRMETKLPCDVMDWLRRTFAKPTCSEVLLALKELINLYLHTCDILRKDIGPQEHSACARIIKEIVRLLSTDESTRDWSPDLPSART